MWWEISVLRRHNQVRPTYQGEISMYEGGGWYAIPATPGAWTGHKIGPFVDYADAEKALVSLRTGVRSIMPWAGPRPAKPGPLRTCGVCGQPVRTGEMCRRRDLHWGPAGPQ